MTYKAEQPLPEISLRSAAGTLVPVGVSRDTDAIVIVFLPLAFSPVCTRELADLTDMADLFSRAEVAVQVVTVDSSATLAAWARVERTDIPLLSDFWPHGEVARRFGAFDEVRGTATRKSVLVEDACVTASVESVPGRARTREQYEQLLARRIDRRKSR